MGWPSARRVYGTLAPGGLPQFPDRHFAMPRRSIPVSVNDIQATILNRWGLDRQRLADMHNGRQYRLTDVAETVLRPILAWGEQGKARRPRRGWPARPQRSRQGVNWMACGRNFDEAQ